VLDIDNIQQKGRTADSPCDRHPQWPQGYIEILADMDVEERRRPFYVHWVRKFFRQYPGRRRKDLGRGEIESFLEILGPQEGAADWKVAQARKALEIYYVRFRGIALDAEGVRFDGPPGGPDTGNISGPRSPAPEHLGSLSQVSPENAVQVDWAAIEKAMRSALRTEHYALRTEKSYLSWIRRFASFHRGRPPSELGAPEIHAFLTHLAVNERVASSTQNQALNAIVFFFRKVVNKDPGDFGDFPRARLSKRLPVVLGRREVQKLWILARLMYGTGMRVSEALRLRVQDLSFERNEIVVRGGKGDKDRRVPFPSSVKDDIRRHLERRLVVYEEDRAKGMHEVELPGALARKYSKDSIEWKWQFVFAAEDYSVDPRSGAKRRHHLHEIRVQRAVRRAAAEAGIHGAGHPAHAAALFRDAPSRGRPGHPHRAGASGTRGCLHHHGLYTHVLNKGPLGVASPLDTIEVRRVARYQGSCNVGGIFP